MKLIILAVLAVIVAGHFIPVSTRDLGLTDACVASEQHFRLLLDQKNKFNTAVHHNLYTQSVEKINPNEPVHSCIVGQKDEKAKLYLW